MQTDCIDVYQLGVPDPDTDLDETLGALTDLVRAGKIRTFGTLKMPPSQIAEARALAERGRATVLARHTCGHRADELVAVARELGIST